MGTRAEERLRRVAGVGLTAALVLALAACNGADDKAPGTAKASGGTAAASPTTPAPPVPAVSVQGSGKLSYSKPVKLTVADGSFTSVQVSTTTGAKVLEGDVAGDGASWLSQTPPRPDSTYKAVATVTDSAGASSTKTVTFKVKKVPSDQKLAFTVTPAAGSTVGIGQPIVVRFLTPVTKRAAVERAMEVSARTSAGKGVTGSWHWLNAQQIDWRPKEFWTPGTKVNLDMKIAGVRASDKHYGRKDYSQSFRIGASHVTKVNASTDRAKVYRNGKLVHTWLTGTGKRGLETYSGTYVVLGKSPVVQMDSCSARITCDKKDPDFYDEKEYWATRVTASGTFLHAASWDGLLGRANVSHGCIHLSDSDAKEFFNHAVIGDIVIVSNTGRGPGQRIATQDPGLYDWNISWSKWKAGSAL